MKPHLVFLHGFGEDSRLWFDFMPEAFSEFSCHRPDFAAWSDCESIAAYARKIVSELPSQESFILIGHSMGGYIALEIANQFPQSTKGVIMLHSTVLSDAEEKKIQRSKTAVFIQEHGSELFIRSFIANLFSNSYQLSHREQLMELVDRYKTLEAHGLVAATLAMKDRTDFQDFLSYTGIPFLFILGDQDPLIPSTGILEILRGKDQHKYVILDEVAHQGCYEAPQETFQAIQKFINEIHV